MNKKELLSRLAELEGETESEQEIPATANKPASPRGMFDQLLFRAQCYLREHDTPEMQYPKFPATSFDALPGSESCSDCEQI